MFNTILIRNASILNLETEAKTINDIYIENGYIKELSNNINRKSELELDANGYIVTPGLVDSHTHGFYGCGDFFGIDPHIYHLPAGVTYVIDQGSAGADCYELYRKVVLARNSIRSKAFLNCARSGMPVSSLTGPGELVNPDALDRDAFVTMYEKHRDELLGIKIRVTPNICPTNPKPFIQKALDIANELEIPLCIHPNQALMDGDELLNMLRPGDIMTHTYHRSKAGILDENGKDTGVDPFMASFPHLIDVGVMGHCIHGTEKIREDRFFQYIAAAADIGGNTAALKNIFQHRAVLRHIAGRHGNITEAVLTASHQTKDLRRHRLHFSKGRTCLIDLNLLGFLIPRLIGTEEMLL